MSFPRHVYKKGTAKPDGDVGQFTAESVLVRDAEHLASLEGEWAESPADCVAEAKPAETMGAMVSAVAAVKPSKRVK